MAYHQLTILLLALFLSTSSAGTTTSRRLLHDNVTPDRDRKPTVDIVGVVHCFAPPTAPTHEPLVAGINVVLKCNGQRTDVGEAVTDTEGFFRITVNAADAIVSGMDSPGPCRAGLRTPIANCYIYPPTGVLEGNDLPIVDELLGHELLGDTVANEHNADREVYGYKGYSYHP